MYETDYNNYQTMTLFNFFPKEKAFKYRLNSIQKENNSNNKNSNDITQKIKSKMTKIKLSQINYISSQKFIKNPGTSRISKNNNKNKYDTIQSRLNLYKTSTNFFKDKKFKLKKNISGRKEKDNIETEKIYNEKNEYSIEKQKSKKFCILDRLLYKSRKKLKNSLKDLNKINKGSVIKKNNYLTDENNTQIYKLYDSKNSKNSKKSILKFGPKENNKLKYYNNQLPLLNKMNSCRKNLILKGLSNTMQNSEKTSTKILVYKNNNFIQNNSDKENNNENNKKDNNQNINYAYKRKINNIVSSYNINNEVKNDYNNNKHMISINSDFGNNNIVFTQSNNKAYKKSIYNSQNNKLKGTCSSNNIISNINNKNNELGLDNSKKHINIFANYTNTNFFMNNKKILSNNDFHEVKYSLNAKKGFLKYENNLITKENDSISTKYHNKIKTTILSKNKINKLEKYNIGKIIGKGAYAIVKLISNKLTNEKYAMKIYEKSKLNDSLKKKCVYKEIEILKRVKHKNIVRLIEIIHSEKQILIIQEYIKGISLREYYNKEIRHQKGISEHKSIIFKKIFKQIFDAMNYLHCNYMAHRDIKLENILLTKEYEIKIIDFGFGMLNPENKIQYFFCGTPNYMPPEIIEKKGYIGQKADLWSLGILVYKIYCADFPFKGKTEKELYQSIKKNQYNIISYVPDDVKKIIKALIEYEPNKRPSCKEILKSQWLKS